MPRCDLGAHLLHVERRVNEEELLLGCGLWLHQRQSAASLELAHDGRDALEPRGALRVIRAWLVLERG